MRPRCARRSGDTFLCSAVFKCTTQLLSRAQTAGPGRFMYRSVHALERFRGLASMPCFAPPRAVSTIRGFSRAMLSASILFDIRARARRAVLCSVYRTRCSRVRREYHKEKLRQRSSRASSICPRFRHTERQRTLQWKRPQRSLKSEASTHFTCKKTRQEHPGAYSVSASILV